MTVRKQVKLEKMNRNFTFMPETLNEENRTVDVVFTTGARVQRFSMFEGAFLEELEVSKRSVMLDRLNAGAPLLNTHRGHDLDSVLGVVENARIENGQGIAQIRFASDEESEKNFRKVKDGILKNLSAGYRVHESEESTEKNADGDKVRVLKATVWEPFEISLVPIPADAGAQVRNQETSFNTCEIIMEERHMPKDLENQNSPAEPTTTRAAEPAKPAEPKVDLELVKREAVEAERVRVSEITEACDGLGLNLEARNEILSQGISADEARKLAIKKVAEQQDKTEHRTAIEVGQEDHQKRTLGMADAICHRSFQLGHGTKSEVTEDAKRFMNMSLIDMARVCAGDKHMALSANDLASRSFHSTSDFPAILEDTARKTLLGSFQEESRTFEPFTKRTTTPDFKTIKRDRLTDVDVLLEMPEGGEYKHGSVSEEKEEYVVKKYGRQFSFTREMLINDDLNAFMEIPAKMGRAARRLESDLVWGELLSNPTMRDGNPLFSAPHANLLAAGALTQALLAEARKLLRLQVDVKGAKLNLPTRWLYTAPAQENEGDQLVTQITPNSPGDVNPFAVNGRTPVTLGVEARIEDSNPLQWFVFSEKSRVAMMELATLSGQADPAISRKEDFDTDGISWKVRHELGVKAIDWRGMVMNPGS